MTCRDARDRDLAEQYCLKQLSAGETADFEDHYFSCQACHADLLAVQELQAHLSRPPVARRPPWQPHWLAIAASCVVVVSVAAWLNSRPVADLYPELARVEPPSYSAPFLRGPEAQGAIAAAMTAYQEKRYAEALAALDAVAKPDPDNVAAPYYAAACELALGHSAEAARRFGEVAAKGESRFQESAFWYEAKAWIAIRNKAGAEQALAKMVALKGERSAEGAVLLERLRPLP